MPKAETATDHAQAADKLLWRIQHRPNERIEDRLSAVNRKVCFASGVAAAAEAMIGISLAVVLLVGLLGSPSSRPPDHPPPSRVLLTGVGLRAVKCSQILCR